MPVRRLTSILAAVLLVLGLSALPTASLARSSASASHRAADDGTPPDDPTIDDTGDIADAPVDVCDTSSDEDLGPDVVDTTDDPTADDTGDSLDFRQADSTDDPAVDDTTDVVDPAICDPAADAIAETAEVTGVDASKLTKTGALVATITTSGPGTADGTLTKGSAVLGTQHLDVKKAGVARLRLKLNSKGRKLLRTSTRTLRLTLKTRVRLDSGKTFDLSDPLTVKPPKKPKKPKKPSKGSHH